MSNSKIAFCLSAALLLTGCSSGSSSSEGQDSGSNAALMLSVLEDDSNSGSSQTQYITYTVTRQDYTASYDGYTLSRVFPHSRSLTYSNDYAAVALSELLVDTGDYVKEGDDLAVLTLSVDSYDAASVSMEYDRELETYEYKCVDYENQLSETGKDSASYESLALEYEYYKNETLAKLEELEEKINGYEDAQENNTVTLKASADGMITDVIQRETGEKIRSGESIITLALYDGWYYTVDDPNKSMHQNAQVDFSFNAGKVEYKISSTIICCANGMLTSSNETATLSIDKITANGEEIAKDSIDPSILPEEIGNVEIETMFLKDVVVVPGKYISGYNDYYYVYRLDGSSLSLVNISCPLGVDTYEDTVVFSGLEDGDVIVLQDVSYIDDVY